MAKFKGALIGCGGRARQHAQALRDLEDVDFVAVADLRDDRATAFAHDYGVKKYLSAEEMLDKEKPDLVCLVTLAAPRPMLTELCATKRVKAIVAEKPMALRLKDADRMVEVCEKNGVLLTISHQMRFDPAFVNAKKAIQNGDIGDVYFIRGVSYGNLMEQGTHILDMVCWYAGDTDIEWGMAQVDGVEPGKKNAAHPAPEFTVGYLAFKNGIRAVIECGRRYAPLPDRPSVWMNKRVEAIGTHGKADAVVGGRCRIVSHKYAHPVEFDAGVDGWNAATAAFIQEVCDALHTGGAHRNNGRNSLRSFEAAQALAQSALTGGAVSLPLSREAEEPLAKLMGY